MDAEALIPKRGVVIAIDGSAGSGKSTLAARLAARYRYPYVNTGLMYRALALRSISRGVEPDDGPGLARLAAELTFDLGTGPDPRLEIDGAEPTDALLSPGVEKVVSRVAGHVEVRQLMRRAQRRLGAGGCVMEGRDIGTVVFPDADVKVFLSAPASVRAARREDERGAGKAVTDRDAVDSRTNPLAPAADAMILDTSTMSRDQVFEEAAAIVRRVLGKVGR
jgi:cytidylate kinase